MTDTTTTPTPPPSSTPTSRCGAPPTPTERAALVAETFTADGRHVDQHADATGHAELAEMIAGVHAGFPGFQMARTSGIDRFGDQLRFAWELNGADGTPDRGRPRRRRGGRRRPPPAGHRLLGRPPRRLTDAPAACQDGGMDIRSSTDDPRGSSGR